MYDRGPRSRTGLHPGPLDGSDFEIEIDLSKSNAAALRSAIEKWSTYARRLADVQRVGRSETSLGPWSQRIRVWAQADGHELAERGRVPETIQALTGPHTRSNSNSFM